MSTDVDTLRREALAELKYPERIRQAAEKVARHLRNGGPVEVALAPGNGTRYCFLFVPFSGLELVPVGDRLESDSVDQDSGVWIARLNGYESDRTVYPLDLLGRPMPPAPTYLAEKWYGGNLSFDVFIFEALLAEIGKRTVPEYVKL